MKLRKVLAIYLCMRMGIMAGCGSQQVMQPGTEMVQETKEREASLPLETQPLQQSEEKTAGKMEGETIILNQLGYLPNAVKKAVFRGGALGDSFDVVDVDSNKVVYTGRIESKIYSAGDARDVFIGQFTSVTMPGKYKIVSKTLGESYEFSIGQDVYKKLLKDAMKFFYYQRCGEELPEGYGGAWAHPACHTEMAVIYGTDQKIDVSGGWHDAGDYGRYVTATSKAAADLMLAYQTAPETFGDDFDIPESGNGVPDILDEVKRQIVWLMKMQDKSSGGVYHKVTCANFPGFVMPQEETAQLIVCPVSTTATGDFAAIMAMGHDVYKSIDPDLSAQCLKAAEKAWNYLEQTPHQSVSNPEGIVTGAYEDTQDEDERLWAAVELFKATGNEKYHQKIKEAAQEIGKGELSPIGYGWQNVGEYAMDDYLNCENADSQLCQEIKSYIEGYVKKYLLDRIKGDAYEVDNNSSDYYWGSNMQFLNEALALQQASVWENSPNDYQEYAVERINYCLGKNPLAMSYVTGYGTVYPKHPHHRLSAASGNTISGMLVGGANALLQDETAKEKLILKPAAQCYIDDQQSYSTNEVDIYWNSALVYALAKLKLV